jgi:hypothetical protein
MGSGIRIRHSIKKHGKENFTKEILDLIDEACKKEFMYGQDAVGGVADEEELELANED